MTGVLPPPYATVVRAPAEPPALGSIVVIDMAGGETALERAILLKCQAPWCPLAAIARSSPLSARAIELLTHLHGPLAFVDYSTDATADFFSEVVTAVRNRVTPEAVSLSAYVANRIGKPRMANVLAEVDAVAGKGQNGLPVPIIRRISRHLHTLGSLGAPDWKWLFKLARLAGRRDLSVEELARRQGVEARTFRTHVRRYTGGSIERFRECVGWEWVLEAALREWGYLTPALVEPGDSAARQA